MTWLVATYLVIETTFTAVLNLVMVYTWWRQWRWWRVRAPERADTAAGMIILLVGFLPVTLVQPLVVWSMLGWIGLNWEELRTVANFGGWICVPGIIGGAGIVTYRVLQMFRRGLGYVRTRWNKRV